MVIWFLDPLLRPDEHVAWRTVATHTQQRRSIGGRLYLTNRRVVFAPSRLDAVMGGKRWERSLAELRGVGEAARSTDTVLGGSLRTRLVLTFEDGTEELFVINRLAEAKRRLSEAIGATDR